MLTKIEQIRVKTHEEWLKKRKEGIGGSDAAAIVGLNPFSTPLSVWADKTSKIPEKEDTEKMKLGRDLEEYVAKRWSEKSGKKVRKINAILRSQKYPFAIADVDRMVVGENAGLECKVTSSLNLKKYKNGEYPANFYVQCVHYMAVTGAKRWYLAILVFGQGIIDFVVQRNQSEIDSLMEQEAEFWEYVKTEKMPKLDGLQPTTDALSQIYYDDEDKSIELFGRDQLIARYFDLANEVSEIKMEQEKIKQELMKDMGDNKYGVCGEYKVIWGNQTRATFDRDAFAEKYPQIDLTPFYNIKESRPFRIINKKERE